MNEKTGVEIEQSETPVMEQNAIYRSSPYQYNLTAPLVNTSQIIGVTITVGDEVTMIQTGKTFHEPNNQ